MKKLLLFVSVGLFSIVVAHGQKKPVDYVNPFIGTAKMGHTYPGATVPFGAIQLSPETDTLSYVLDGKYNKDVYRYCAGYQYDDPTIVGFSHTHFSGTGHSDLGDFLIMPTVGPLRLNPGTADKPGSGYRSRYSHQHEKASPNYYQVYLSDYSINAELTATERVGVHRYTFPKSDQSHLIVDLMAGIYNYPEKNVWTVVRVVNDTLITGYRQTNGWARTRTVYFAMSLSKPFKSYGSATPDKETVYKGFWRKFNQRNNFPDLASANLKLYFDFDTEDQEQIIVKLAVSPVSQKNALENLQQEAASYSFDQLWNKGRDKWSKELEKISVETVSDDDKVNFYTSLYHTFLGPTLYMDHNREYKGLDQDIHHAQGFTNYTTFSLWDTYRALHPFFNIVQPQRNADMVSSMLQHYNQSVLGMLPIWSHYANDNWCMSGYHSVSVIADAILKGTYKGDAEQALDACVRTSQRRDFEGIGAYTDLGYIPAESNSNSVSSTLEYAYDDWCIAQLAKKIGKDDIYQTYIKRSQNWKNVFDSTIGFMRPKDAMGNFVANFDVLDTHGQGFIEGNSWNYSLFIPHDPMSLVRIYGGDKKFITHLDSLFEMHLPDEFFENTEDITREGIIGNYVHGNEPSHHVVYLYNYAGAPHKTQKRVRDIIQRMYRPTPDGLGGNDDCGQMSAWYLFGALGFYPLSPGATTYDIGSPVVKRAVLHLDNGRKFEIVAHNQGAQNVFVKQVMLNGKKIDNWKIDHQDIMNGGKLEYFMTAKRK